MRSSFVGRRHQRWRKDEVGLHYASCPSTSWPRCWCRWGNACKGWWQRRTNQSRSGKIIFKFSFGTKSAKWRFHLRRSAGRHSVSSSSTRRKRRSSRSFQWHHHTSPFWVGWPESFDRDMVISRDFSTSLVRRVRLKFGYKVRPKFSYKFRPKFDYKFRPKFDRGRL